MNLAVTWYPTVWQQKYKFIYAFIHGQIKYLPPLKLPIRTQTTLTILSSNAWTLMNRYSVSELLTLFMVNTHKPTLVLQGVNLLNFMNFIVNAPNTVYLPPSLLIMKKILKNSVVTLNNSENAIPLCRIDKFSRHFRKCENTTNIYYILQSCLYDCFSVSLFICNHKTPLPIGRQSQFTYC